MSACGSALYYTAVFLAAQLPIVLEPAVGLPGMFAVFAAFSGVVFVVVLVLVEETQGKTYRQHLSSKQENLNSVSL